ncbi:MAG: DUF4419 domain-containing protein [Candidatus Melainabacteria bacterium]|nr:DUF4419 domain-containing protein [Candidatus Melainabacteria bacterium]
MASKIIILDSSLTPVEVVSDREERSSLLKSTFSPGANSYDWRRRQRTVGEQHFAMGLPEAALMFHQNYLGYLSQAYASHSKIVLSPEIFWYTVLCEIAQHIATNPEAHRAIFTREAKQKIEISVFCNSEFEPLKLDSIYAGLVNNCPVDTEMFLPEFSTTSEVASLAMLAEFT